MKITNNYQCKHSFGIGQSFLFSLVCLFMMANVQTYAQVPAGNGTIIKDWQEVRVSHADLKFDYSVIECNGSNQLCLRIKNTSTSNLNSNFKIQVINADNKSYDRFSKDLSITLANAQLVQGGCDAGNPAQLKMALPANFDPNKLYIAFTF